MRRPEDLRCGRLAASNSAHGLPLEEARSRVLAGTALSTIDRAQAIHQLQRAERLFAGAGADRHAQDVGRRLRALGVRNWRRGPSREAGQPLSHREHEVAVLAASGATNPQTAKELFLSVKTVETHLRNVFWKLEVTSRIQLAHRDDLRTPVIAPT